MDRIKLISPTTEHKDGAEEYKKEFFDYVKTLIHGKSLITQGA